VLLPIHEGSVADPLVASLRHQGECIEAVPSATWPFSTMDATILSFKAGVASILCLAESGDRVGTARRKVRFFNPIFLPEISFQAIGKELHESVARQWNERTAEGGSIPPATWAGVVKALLTLAPEQAESIERLFASLRVRDRTLSSELAAQLSMERDALGVALDIFAPATRLRHKVLRSWGPREDDVALLEGDKGPAKQSQVPLPNFMEGIDEVYLRESDMLIHDRSVWPTGVGLPPSAVGARFEVGGARPRVLTIIYANQSKMEIALGVDLIYHHQGFEAFTLVQYKRLTKRDKDVGEPKYYPDQQFRIELARMDAFRAMRPDAWHPLHPAAAYRLDGDGFYFKFCPARQLVASFRGPDQGHVLIT